MEQLQNWSVCQICGLTRPREETTPENGWLVSPLRRDPSWLVIRCPKHLSDHAFRNSYAGRTNEWRERMEMYRDWEPPMDPLLEPFPIND